jgi:hypothetical protein
MTVYNCSLCGGTHDTSKDDACTKSVTVTMPPDPKSVGRQIRTLLLSLKAATDPGVSPWQSHSTDALRRAALDYAGICWLAPGEMAPACCCAWSDDAPDGPRRELEARLNPSPGDGAERVRLLEAVVEAAVCIPTSDSEVLRLSEALAALRAHDAKTRTP